MCYSLVASSHVAAFSLPGTVQPKSSPLLASLLLVSLADAGVILLPDMLRSWLETLAVCR
jgi:hypothetical protein